MKTFSALVQEAANVAQEIKTIEQFFTDSRANVREMINEGRIEDYKTMRRDMEAQEIEKSKRLELLKVAQKILKDNIRVAYFTETMPKVLEVLKKYEGKPIGEKTEAKIRAELKERGIYFSINYGGKYGSDYIHISPVEGVNKNFWYFSYDETKVLTKYDGGEKRPMLGGNGGNRLIVYDPDIYYLSWCSDYVDDYMFRANTILYKYKELKEQRERLEAEYKSLNDLLPHSMDRLDISKHLYNSIA